MPSLVHFYSQMTRKSKGPLIVGAGWCRVDCGAMVCDLVGLRGRVGSLEEGRENRQAYTEPLCGGVWEWKEEAQLT